MKTITLKAARVNAGFTQKEAADKMKISTTTLCNWETGRAEPSYSDMYLMASIYGVSMDVLILPEVQRNVVNE